MDVEGTEHYLSWQLEGLGDLAIQFLDIGKVRDGVYQFLPIGVLCWPRFVIYGFYYIERDTIPLISTLLRFCIINWCWIISNAFSTSVDRIM